MVAVAPGSLAETAGLMRGDIVVGAGGRPVGGEADIAAALALTPAGGKLRLSLLRAGNGLELEVPVAE